MSNDSISLVSQSHTTGTENINSAPCGICRRQFSRYTCPKCNLPYCSLTCFRSSAHSGCSEVFYRKEVENDIHAAPSKTAEERRQMMELLRRFEEGKDEDLDILGDGESDESDSDENLENRLSKLDLDGASYDELWSALTPAEREKFLKALNDPSSELAQQLLTSEELETQIIEPWWQRPADHEDEAQPPTLGTSRIKRRFGDKPEFVDIPPFAKRAAEAVGTSGPSLLYNICAVILSYSYITRYLSSSPLSSISPQDTEHEEACKLFSRLVPFLTDRKSKTVLPSLSGVITDLWSRFEPDTMTPTLFALIMRDAASLLRPSPVVSLSPAASDDAQHEYARHPCSNVLRALSDVSMLFHSAPPSAAHQHAVSPVTAKIAFYAARIMSVPTYVLTALADEVVVRAKLVEREGTLGSSVAEPNAVTPLTSQADTEKQQDSRPRIEELT